MSEKEVGTSTLTIILARKPDNSWRCRKLNVEAGCTLGELRKLPFVNDETAQLVYFKNSKDWRLCISELSTLHGGQSYILVKGADSLAYLDILLGYSSSESDSPPTGRISSKNESKTSSDTINFSGK